MTTNRTGNRAWAWTKLAAVGLMVSAWALPGWAASYSWTNTAATVTNWNISAKWSPSGFPNAVGDVAYLTNNFSGIQTIYLNQSSVTVGVLNVGDAAATPFAVILTNNGTAGTLVLDNAGNPAQINQSSASAGDTIAVPVQLAAGLVVSNASATKALTISGIISGIGNIVIQTSTLTLAPMTDYVLAKNISGGGSLVKDGPSTLTLTGTNSIIFNGNSGLTGGGALVLSGGIFSNLVASSATAANKYFPFGSAGNTFVVSNGAAYYASVQTADTDAQFNQPANTVVVTGLNSLWNHGSNRFDMASAGNTVVISEGAVVTNASRVWVGGASGANSNSLTISNGGRLLTGYAGALGGYVGLSCSSSTLTIGGTNSITGAPATMDTGGYSLTVGSGAGCGYNSLVVSAGGVLTNAASITLGASSASFNSLVITNGGQVFESTQGYIGSSGPSNTCWVGGTDPNTGMPSLWSLPNSLLIGGATVGNTMTVTAGGVVTNVANSGAVVGYGTGGHYSTLVISNNARLYVAAGGVNVGNAATIGNQLLLNNALLKSVGQNFIGNTGSNNSLVVTANGVWDASANAIFIGSSTGAAGAGASNRVMVTAGGVITNVSSYGVEVGAAPGSHDNSLTITNGGHLYMSGGSLDAGAWSGNPGVGPGGNNNTVSIGSGVLKGNTSYDSYIGYGSMGNTATLYGDTRWDAGGQNLYVGYGVATGNALRVDGCTVTNVALFTVGQTNGAANNTVTVLNGGTLSASTVQAGLFTAAGSLVQVSAGGLLEGNTFTVGAGGGNLITNSGGIYQFTTTTPAITNNGLGIVALDNGIIAFRGVRGVDVKGNWTASLTNIAFSGVNAFRLNNATNSATVPQSYVFNTGSATNYAGLEMINGGTAYTNGSVTIGSPVSTNGWLTFSNTTAIMWGAVTNYGRLSIVDSTVTFKTNLVMAQNCTLFWASNSVGNTVRVNGTLTLPVSANLTVTGALPGINDGLTLFQSSNTVSGSAAGWTITPPDYKLNKSTDGKSLVLRPKLIGFVFKVQ